MLKAISGTILSIVLIVALFIGYSQYQDYKSRLAATAGNGLFNVLTSYKDFYQEYEEEPELSVEYIKESKEELETIFILSKNLDFALGYQALGPIASDFQAIMDTIEVEYENNKEMSKNRFDDLITMINELEDIVYSNYYKENQHHGGQAKLNLNDVEDINDFKDKLDNYLINNTFNNK